MVFIRLGYQLGEGWPNYNCGRLAFVGQELDVFYLPAKPFRFGYKEKKKKMYQIVLPVVLVPI